MTDLNKVNFMSKTRFDNLSVTNDDELYIVETDMAIDSEVVHKTGNETISGNKTFSNNVVVSGATTLNNTLTVNNTLTTNNLVVNNGENWSYIVIKNAEGNNAIYSNLSIEFKPLSTSSHGGYIDFHYNGSSDDYTARLIEDVSGQISYQGSQRMVATNSTSSGVLAVKGWVNNPETATNVVHRSGNESLSGTKTFLTSTWMQSANDMSYLIKSVNADNTAETQTNLTQGNFRVVDNNNKIIGDLRVVRSTTGTSTTSIIARNYASDSNGVTATISCAVDNEGNIYTSAPTPASPGDNSTQIATTAWVNSKIQFVNALPASPVSGVLYLIPET